MITKKDVKEMFDEADERLERKFSSFRKEVKDDLETAVAQVIEFVMKYAASKEDLKQLATKEELSNFKEEVRGEFKEVKRQINDLKADLPTPQEFADHEKRITNLETVAFPQ